MFPQQLGSCVCTGWGSEDKLCLLRHLVWVTWCGLARRTSGNSTEATLWAALPVLHSPGEGSPAEGHSAAGQAAVWGYQEQRFLLQIRAPMTGGCSLTLLASCSM